MSELTIEEKKLRVRLKRVQGACRQKARDDLLARIGSSPLISKEEIALLATALVTAEIAVDLRYSVLWMDKTGARKELRWEGAVFAKHAHEAKYDIGPPPGFDIRRIPEGWQP